jgi:hypothetical protein
LLTVNARVIGLDKGLLDLAILHQQSIPLAAIVAEDGGAVEAQIKSLGELASWVTQEADLFNREDCVNHKFTPSKEMMFRDIRRSCPGDPRKRPKPESCIGIAH